HRLERADTALAHLLAAGLTATEHRLATAATRLNLLSPYAVLERGYSLTTDEKGAVLRDAAEVAPGAVVRTRLRHGTLTSVVT
ncbi:MAG: exodeoxyribonuclease VII large subunit, partial [Kiritimatiellae bacterium]|nr:exodeoxyribonuclease VII large subunit [Kiritimatiellia bacterium]